MDADHKYCKHCGEIIDIDCIICPKCGKQVEAIPGLDNRNVVINNNVSSYPPVAGYHVIVSPKSRLVALLLCFFLGFLGVHRFYVGKAGTALIMILLMFTGVGEVWWTIDFFVILFGGFTDKVGFKLKNW